MAKEESKTKTVKMLLNLGAEDKQKYGLPEAYRERDIVTLDGSVADVFLSRLWAVEYTDEVKKADEDADKAEAERAIAAARPLAAIELAKEEAKAHLKGDRSAKREVKDGTAGKVVESPSEVARREEAKAAADKPENFNKIKPVSSTDVK
jgi:hypothetical protein